MSIMKTLTINGVQYTVTPVVPTSSVTLLAGAWVKEGEKYYQVVDLAGVTAHTKVNLQPTPEQLVEFQYKVLAFVAENEAGVVKVYAIGDKPQNDHTIQVTLKEVEGTGVIRGTTVGTTTPRSNLEQTDPEQADYILGKEAFVENCVAPVVNKLASDLAIVNTAGGEVISVPDASDMSVQGLRIYGKPTQDGTPTPEAPVELVSVGASGAINTTAVGKNLFNKDDFTYLKAYVDGDGIIKGYSSGSRTVLYIPCSPNTTYTASRTAVVTSERFGLGWTEEIPATVMTINTNTNMQVSATIGNKITHTITTGATAKYLVCYLGWTDRVNEAETLQIEVGYVATPYEPYNAQTLTAQTPNGLPGIPVTSGGNYTDANGQQWICDEVDFAKGVYVQRLAAVVFDGVSEGRCATGRGQSSTEKYAYVVPTATWGRRVGRDVIAVCSHYVFSGVAADSNKVANNNFQLCYASGSTTTSKPGSAYFGHNSLSTVEEYNAFLAEQYAAGTPVTVMYELATPIETPLSAEELAQYAALHTNKPNTTVFNDSSAYMEMEYVADTKLYIDKKFTELQNAILATGANI